MGKTYGKHLKHILVLQNKTVRVIACATPRINVDNLYLELDILPVKTVSVYTIGIFIYEYINWMLPE